MRVTFDSVSFPKKEVIVSGAESYLADPKFSFLVQRLRAICINQATKMQVPIERLEISVKRDQEEHWIELVLHIFVPLNMEQSLALWDAIGDAIQQWAGYLPVEQARVLAEQIGVFVEPLEAV